MIRDGVWGGRVKGEVSIVYLGSFRCIQDLFPISESLGQNLPFLIRGIEYPGQWIARSDVRQNAARKRPNHGY